MTDRYSEVLRYCLYKDLNEKEGDGSRIVGDPSGKFVGKLFVSTLKEVSI